jgi:hypothetical protein
MKKTIRLKNKVRFVKQRNNNTRRKNARTTNASLRIKNRIATPNPNQTMMFKE